MRFRMGQIRQQTQFMVEKLTRSGAIEMPTRHLNVLCDDIAAVIESFIRQQQNFQDRVDELMQGHALSDKRARHYAAQKLAEQEKFPLEDEAVLRHLNTKLEDLLMDHQHVEDVFLDSRELTALITPYLKAMAGEGRF